MSQPPPVSTTPEESASLTAVLRSLAELPVTRYFPATGPVMADGPTQAQALADALDEYCASLQWRSGAYVPPTVREYPVVGRYRQLHRGIYQIANFGNCILLIDDHGRGLMVDPGPCDYESPTRVAAFHDDLDRFERECGLRTIDLALITHVHGDHYDMVPALRERYPVCQVGALDLVAQVVRSPRDYPYAALLPWYNLGLERVDVDIVLHEDAPYDWHDVAIRSIHLPGHCYCHAGYLLTFRGLHLALTGDTIQSWGEANGLSFIIANHSVPDERSGILKSYRRMVGEPVDLNLGGHSSHFTNCPAMYAESLRRIEHTLPYLRRLVPGGDLDAAFLRPGFPRWQHSHLPALAQNVAVRGPKPGGHHPGNPIITQLTPELRVYSLVGEATSHLVMRRGKSLLIDCHSPQLGDWIRQQGLPQPELILHTHVQPEHCREAGQFPTARILVHAALVELAGDPVGYARAIQTRWDHPADWPVTMGREKYGIAGSVTAFPPEPPLKIAGTFHEGDRLPWQDLTLVVRALPGHSLQHVGFVLELAGEALAVFTGDLLRAPAQLVNIYDLEINYGGTALPIPPPHPDEVKT